MQPRICGSGLFLLLFWVLRFFLLLFWVFFLLLFWVIPAAVLGAGDPHRRHTVRPAPGGRHDRRSVPADQDPGALPHRRRLRPGHDRFCVGDAGPNQGIILR